MSFKKPQDHIGCTVWLTGLSGSGKTTVARTITEFLSKFHIPVEHLDGDALRKGLNADLDFTKESRKENNRRVAEVAALCAKSGSIAITSLISPFAEHRKEARNIHENLNLKFFEVYVNAPIEICEARDPKHFYRKAKTGEIPNFTGISMPYEQPACPDLLVDTSFYTYDQCRNKVLRMLVDHHLIPSAVMDPVDAHLPFLQKNNFIEASALLPKINISKTSLQWAQVIAEGWATPLAGFMDEDELLQCMHFKTITVDNMTHNQSIPIVLPITDEEEASIHKMSSVCLNHQGKSIGLLTDIKAYEDRKRERASRTFGCLDSKHPVIDSIINSNTKWLLGGKLKLFERITWDDGLDEYRLTPTEILSKLRQMSADATFAFQVRNPLHNGHILLIKETRKLLESRGYKNPILLLHPIGGWTKDDDIPLHIRIKQHQAIIDEGLLEEDKTILSIFPSPMLYAGPTEVQWHVKGRIVAGIDHYIVGRDPAGIKDPSNPNEDLYFPEDGARLLEMAPGLNCVKIVPFRVAAINKHTNEMEILNDNSKPEDYESISGTKMRQMARDGEDVPEAFMNSKAWKILSDYYQSLQGSNV